MAFESNFSYVVIYLVNWRKVASKSRLHFAAQKERPKKQFFGTEYIFYKCNSLRSQTLLLAYSKLVRTFCRPGFAIAKNARQ